jgi:hypothetical protein
MPNPKKPKQNSQEGKKTSLSSESTAKTSPFVAIKKAVSSSPETATETPTIQEPTKIGVSEPEHNPEKISPMVENPETITSQSEIVSPKKPTQKETKSAPIGEISATIIPPIEIAPDKKSTPKQTQTSLLVESTETIPVPNEDSPEPISTLDIEAPTPTTTEPELEEGENLDIEAQEVTSEPLEQNVAYFQAIGTLYCQVEQNLEEKKFFITLGDRQYALYFDKPTFFAFLKQYTTKPEAQLYLRVYPKCLIIPQQDPIIKFHVLGWDEENKFEEEAGIFRLKGVWQFVPQLRSPVISIYRNKDAEDPTGKFKATHLPVLMRRDDGVNPFRFNPKIPKEDLPKRYFVQSKFRFMPQRNCWGWVEDIEPPREKLPWYKKPVKAAPNEINGRSSPTDHDKGTGQNEIREGSLGNKAQGETVSIHEENVQQEKISPPKPKPQKKLLES